MRRDISNVFSDLQKEIVSKIDKLPLKSLNNIATKAGINDGIELFDIEDWQYEISKATNADVSGVVIDSIKRILAQTNMEFVQTDWAKMIAKATELSTSKITVSIETIHQDLIDTIDNVIKENAIPQDLLRDKLRSVINSKFDMVYNGSRADMIAQTTATHAQGTATKATCKELDLNYVWISQRDGRVRPSHFAADGKKPDANGMFNVGGDSMEHPAGGSIARENVNCRCYLFAQKR